MDIDIETFSAEVDYTVSFDVDGSYNINSMKIVEDTVVTYFDLPDLIGVYEGQYSPDKFILEDGTIMYTLMTDTIACEMEITDIDRDSGIYFGVFEFYPEEIEPSSFNFEIKYNYGEYIFIGTEWIQQSGNYAIEDELD